MCGHEGLFQYPDWHDWEGWTQYPHPEPMNRGAMVRAQTLLRTYLSTLTPEQMQQFADLNQAWLNPDPDPMVEVRQQIQQFLDDRDSNPYTLDSLHWFTDARGKRHYW